jgi:hypothetical protein
MNRVHEIAVAAVLASVAWVVPSFADEPMRILTYPTGLVTDELEVKVELGPSGL